MVHIALASLIALLASAGLCRVVMFAGLSDPPNEQRKAHSVPTPTSGGLAMGAAFALALAWLVREAAVDWGPRLPSGSGWSIVWVFVGAFVALMLGAADDVRPLGPRVKFLVLGCGALLFAGCVAHARYFTLGPGVTLDVGLVFGILGSALWIFTLSNSVNFMDGANGLAMGSVAVGLLGLAGIAAGSGAWHGVATAVLGAAALSGFLVWNFPKGKLFAGDAGALFAGALAALISLVVIRDGQVSPLIPPLLFFPLLADVLLTLHWRVRQGRPWLQPHADHLFQIALRAGWTHGRVAVVYWVVSAHCAAVGVLAAFGPKVAREWSGQPFPSEHPLVMGLLWLVALAPWVALASFALISIRVSSRVRAFAVARGLIAPG